MCPKTPHQFWVQTFRKIFKYECYNLFKHKCALNTILTSLCRYGPTIWLPTLLMYAHLYVIIMFLGLAVRHFSLFGSTEEPVAHLTKESCLRGQELHTCGKGKKKHPWLKLQRVQTWLTVPTTGQNINETNLTNRVVRVEGRERVVVDCRRCCICFLLHTLVITFWFVHLFLSCGETRALQFYCIDSTLINGWLTEEKASSLN